MVAEQIPATGSGDGTNVPVPGDGMPQAGAPLTLGPQQPPGIAQNNGMNPQGIVQNNGMNPQREGEPRGRRRRLDGDQTLRGMPTTPMPQSPPGMQTEMENYIQQELQRHLNPLL